MMDRKKEIQKRFDRAASTYDGYADVQQETALELSHLLAGQTLTTILELGCGTGGFTRILKRLFPQAVLSCLDFSEAMLSEAREKVGSESAAFHCVDCEAYLAVTEETYDCICSNATFQWFQEPQCVLKHIHHALAEDGLFVASVFGPNCLAELGAGLREVMGSAYALPSSQFLAEKQLQTLCHDFDQVEIHERVYTRTYGTLYELLRAIKYTGTGGFHTLVPRFNKANLQSLSDWFMDRGGFRVEYQVFFLKAVRGK